MKQSSLQRERETNQVFQPSNNLVPGFAGTRLTNPLTPVSGSKVPGDLLRLLSKNQFGKPAKQNESKLKF